MSLTAILIFAFIFLGVYSFTFRKIGNIIKESLSERKSIFNEQSTQFYRLLTFSPVVVLFVLDMIVFYFIEDWIIFVAVFACSLILYHMFISRLCASLFWANANPSENADELKGKMKTYCIISLILSVLGVWFMITLSITNDDFFMYPYTWLFAIAIIAANVIICKEYPLQSKLLIQDNDNMSNKDTDKTVKQSISVVPNTSPQSKPTKRCPCCGEEILAVAKKCKHCGEWLDVQSK